MSNQAEIQSQALSRAVGNQSTMNYGAIFEGFMAMGIPEDDIKPRENVFTFHAWKALGRSVKKGEHGVKVCTWIPTVSTDKVTGEEKHGKYPRTTTVFHVSQTQGSDAPRVAITEAVGRRDVIFPDARRNIGVDVLRRNPRRQRDEGRRDEIPERVIREQVEDCAQRRADLDLLIERRRATQCHALSVAV